METFTRRNDDPSGPLTTDMAWLLRSFQRLEATLEKLGEKVDSLDSKIATEIKALRESSTNNFGAVSDRVSKIEQQLAVLKFSATIGGIVGVAILTGLVAIAVPKLWGDNSSTDRLQRIEEQLRGRKP